MPTAKRINDKTDQEIREHIIACWKTGTKEIPNRQGEAELFSRYRGVWGEILDEMRPTSSKEIMFSLVEFGWESGLSIVYEKVS